MTEATPCVLEASSSLGYFLRRGVAFLAVSGLFKGQIEVCQRISGEFLGNLTVCCTPADVLSYVLLLCHLSRGGWNGK